MRQRSYLKQRGSRRAHRIGWRRLFEFGIILNWTDNSDNEQGFYIYRAGTTWVRVGNVAEDVTEWADNGLEDSTLYRYYVEAIGLSQNSDKSNVDFGLYPRHWISAELPQQSAALQRNRYHGNTTATGLGMQRSRFRLPYLRPLLRTGDQQPPLRAPDLTEPTLPHPDSHARYGPILAGGCQGWSPS